MPAWAAGEVQPSPQPPVIAMPTPVQPETPGVSADSVVPAATLSSSTPPTSPNEASRDDVDIASSEVTNLYLDYRLKIGLVAEQHPEAWEEAAKNYPLYATRVNDLFQALREAEKVKKESYPEADILMQKLNFYMVENEASRMLLTDILWRRVTDSVGKLDRKMNFPAEASSMLKEMGVSEEEIRHQVEISPFEVIKSILSGKLRVNRLPSV